jgi:hypothetical protein
MSKETDNFKHGQGALICNSYTFGNTVYDIYGLLNTLIIFWPVWIHSNMVTRFQMSDLWPNSRYYSTELMSQNDRIITTRECPLKAIKMCQECWNFGLCPSSGILKIWKNSVSHFPYYNLLMKPDSRCLYSCNYNVIGFPGIEVSSSWWTQQSRYLTLLTWGWK